MSFFKWVLLLAISSFAVCTKISMPTDYSSISSGTRANLKANFDHIQTTFNPCADSVDEVRARMSGYTGDFTVSALDNLRLRLDTDGSLLGKFFILNGSTGDTLFRVSEDSTWKVYGNGTARKLTLSDSIVAVTARLSGNGSFGGNLGVTGSTSLAGLTATTGSFSSTLNVTGAATTTGVHTFTAAPVFSSATASLPMFTNGSKALVSNAMTGTGSVVMSASPTLTGTAAFANTTNSGTLDVTGVTSLTGNLNLNGATNTSIYGFNAKNTNVSMTRTAGVGGVFYGYGLGDPSAANAEFLQIYHDGTNGFINSNKNGTGTVRSLKLQTGGTDAITISSTQAVNIAGATTLAGGLTSSVGGGYEEGTFTATLTGVSGTVTNTAYFTRIGKHVTLEIPWMQGTSNAATLGVSGLPVSIRPARAMQLLGCSVKDNGSEYFTQWPVGNASSCSLINTDGTISCALNGNGAGFTTSGTKGIGNASYSGFCMADYTLQ